MKQSSDPLPYVQVDRAVKPKVGLLAGIMKVSNQHALGSLVEWWELCGDPRELERIAIATPEDKEPAVVLTGDDVARRFRAASGHQIDPEDLATIGLLEPLEPGRYRVRGMSRYFAPVQARIRAKAVASAGGKASAEARKKLFGTAQPPAQPRSAASSGVGSGQFEPSRTDSRTDSRTETEPTPEAESNRNRTLAYSVQRSSNKRSAPKEDSAPAMRDSDELCRVFREVLGADYLWQGAKDGAALARLLKAATLNEVLARWRRGLSTPESEWASCRNVAQLASKWNDLVPEPQKRLSIEERPSRML